MCTITVMLHLPFGICSQSFGRDDGSSGLGTGHDRFAIGGITRWLVRGCVCLDRVWDNIKVAPVSAYCAIICSHCI